jgi:hypothetical protein
MPRREIMKASVLKLMILLYCFISGSANAIVFTNETDSKTFEIELVKSIASEVYYGRTDYIGYDKNDKMRFALYSNGRMSSIPQFYYNLYDSDSQLFYRSDLFEINSSEFEKIENNIVSLKNGCNLTLLISTTTYSLQQIKKNCPQ